MLSVDKRKGKQQQHDENKTQPKIYEAFVTGDNGIGINAAHAGTCGLRGGLRGTTPRGQRGVGGIVSIGIQSRIDDRRVFGSHGVDGN